MNADLTVYFDGACPLCRREIDFYRRRRGADRIQWVDVSSANEQQLSSGLCRSDALARFHVRRSDGRLDSGGRAFAELWYALPDFRWLGRIARTPLLTPVLETAYRGFLHLRPAMQRLARHVDKKPSSPYPRWLERALRSDHAGETGAVAIYQGILAVTRDAELREFASQHMNTESRHRAVMEALVAPERRSKLLPLWRAAGFVTGALPAVLGPRAVYATIDAVETFVDGHYREQIDALDGDPRWVSLRDTLEACRLDEIIHRDEARQNLAGEYGTALRLWSAMINVGSKVGVAIASRI